MRPVGIGKHRYGNDFGAAEGDGGRTAVDGNLQGFDRQFTGLQFHILKGIGGILTGSIHDLIGSDLRLAFAGFGPGTGDGCADGIALGQAGDNGFAGFQGLTVIDLFRRRGGDGHGILLLGNGQGTQVFLHDIVILIGVAPFQFIGVVAFADLRLGAGGGDLNGRIQHDGGEGRFFAAQHPGVVIGDLGIDGDADVGGILHEVILVGSGHLQAADGNRLLPGFGKSGNEFLQDFRIPAGFLTGGGHQVRVFRVEAQDLRGQVFFSQLLDDELQGFTLFSLLEGNGKALAGGELHVLRLAGEGVGGVNIGDAGNGDHLFAAQSGLGHERGILPGGILRFVAGDGTDTGVLAGEGFAVILLLGRAGPDGDRGLVHDQVARDGRDIGEVGSDILPGGIGNAVGRDHVIRMSRVGYGTGAGDGNVEIGWEAGDQRGIGTGQGMTVIQFAGGLGHDGDRTADEPVSIRGEGFFRGVIREGAFQQGRAVLAAVGDAFNQDRIRGDGFRHEAGDVLGGHGREDGAGARGVVPKLGSNDLPAGGNRKLALGAFGIRIGHLGGAFQNAEGGGRGIFAVTGV